MEQFKELLGGIVFVFESNYLTYVVDKDSEKAYKFMAQAACQNLANRTEKKPDLVDPLLIDALNKILSSSLLEAQLSGETG